MILVYIQMNMDTHGIIDPDELDRIHQENAKKLRFQTLKQNIIQRICKQWKTDKIVHEIINNEYYKLEYTIKNCWNRTGNRTLKMFPGGEIHDYNYNDIQYRIRRILER